MRFKPSEALRFLGGLAAAAAVLGAVALRVTSCAPTPRPAPTAPTVPTQPYRPPPLAGPAPVTADCAEGPADAARLNAASLRTLPWAPFGRPETGWEIYSPLIAHEIASGCAPDTPAFAHALAAWQGRQGLVADGLMSAATFERMNNVLELRRPFVQLSARNICPAAPDEASLAQAAPAEGYSGKPIRLRPAALAAYRQMAAAARAAVPEAAADPRALTIFSGFRTPDADTARCLAEGNCDGVVRANCSAHRTGLAVDLHVGQAPGFGPDSSADPNRLYISRTPLYRWMAANAGRFGFLPYPFEPWHWEWTGQAP